MDLIDTRNVLVVIGLFLAFCTLIGLAISATSNGGCLIVGLAVVLIVAALRWSDRTNKD